MVFLYLRKWIAFERTFASASDGVIRLDGIYLRKSFLQYHARFCGFFYVYYTYIVSIE
jgi:hypothetical protein